MECNFLFVLRITSILACIFALVNLIVRFCYLSAFQLPVIIIFCFLIVLALIQVLGEIFAPSFLVKYFHYSFRFLGKAGVYIFIGGFVFPYEGSVWFYLAAAVLWVVGLIYIILHFVKFKEDSQPLIGNNSTEI